MHTYCVVYVFAIIVLSISLLGRCIHYELFAITWKNRHRTQQFIEFRSENANNRFQHLTVDSARPHILAIQPWDLGKRRLSCVRMQSDGDGEPDA